MPEVANLPEWASTLRTALDAATGDLADLYESMGLEHDGGWVGQALAGQRRPSNDELSVLSAYADVPLTVLAGYVAPEDNLKVALRAGLIDLASEDLATAEHARTLLAILRELIPLFPGDVAGRDSRMSQARTARSGTRYAPRAGREAAENLRAVLDLGDEPIVELTSLVESLGCPVTVTELPPGVHGMTVHDEQRRDWRAVILVSTEDAWTRQRYTVAHELCHVVYRDGSPVIVDRKDDVDESDWSEWRAECFARHFLAPTATVRQVWEQYAPKHGESMALAQLMMHCGISRPAAIRAVSEATGIPHERLAALGQQPVRQLMEQAGLRAAWESACTGQNDPGASEWLLEMALGAYRAGLISATTVADVLHEQDISTVAADLRRQGWGPAAP